MPRPLSEVTDFETDIEDDGSEMQSMDDDSLTTISDDVATPVSNTSSFDFETDRGTQGPKGPHLFSDSSLYPDSSPSSSPRLSSPRQPSDDYIVAIEQVLPKAHSCSKGENCSKWQKQQRKLKRLQNEFPVSLTTERLSTVCQTTAQENVLEFLDYQHMEHVAPTRRNSRENLRHLPKLTIPLEAPAYGPMTPASAVSSIRDRTPQSARRHYSKAILRNDPYHYGGVASPADLYQTDSPTSATDLPIFMLVDDPLDRETSHSVPPAMRFGGPAPVIVEPIQRSQSTQPYQRRSPSAYTRMPEAFPPGHRRKPSSAASTLSPVPESEVAHSGPMKMRKTTRLFSHEWQEHHFTLKGTHLAMHKDEASSKRDSLALDRIDVDDYAVALSSASTSPKRLTTAFKKSSTRAADEKSFNFSLIPSEIKRQFFESKKSHHFAVNSSEGRNDWMREIILAKALKKSRATGSQVCLSGNVI